LAALFRGGELKLALAAVLEKRRVDFFPIERAQMGDLRRRNEAKSGQLQPIL
jgi:hypothetical protein